MARLVGDQLQQHELQLARVEDAPAAAASFARLAVAAEAVTTAMAERTSTRTVIAGEFQRPGLVRSGVAGRPAEAAAVMAVVAAPVAPALVVAVSGVGESHLRQRVYADRDISSGLKVLVPARSITPEAGANILRSLRDYWVSSASFRGYLPKSASQLP